MTHRRLVWGVLLAAACGGASSEAPPVTTARTFKHGDTTISFSQGEVSTPTSGTSLDLSGFEVRADETDRFVHCPPSTDLGQGWIPPLPEWKPPAVAAQETGEAPPQTAPLDVQGMLPLTRTEKALEDTRGSFRDCYHRGLVHDPMQDGHAAVVLRLDRTGKVARAETYGACGLQPEVLRCLREVGSKLKFAAPAPGDETVVLPAAFAPRAGSSHFVTANDGYTAAAYLAFEALRPQLHVCETRARTSNRRIDAFGTFTMEIDSRGHASNIAIDPWGGEQSILSCAAEALQALKLDPPPGGHAAIVVRLSFNPRR